MGDKGKAGRTILRNAMLLVEDYHVVNAPKTEHMLALTRPVSWQPPSHGLYKVNIDGAVFLKRKQVGARVVIRDGDGEVIVALSKRWGFLLGAIEAGEKTDDLGEKKRDDRYERKEES